MPETVPMPTPPIIQLLSGGDATAYYTTRGTCRRESPYSGFNLCHYTGDAPVHTTECRDSLSRYFNIATDRIIIPRQTHSTNVATIETLPIPTSAIDGVDAVVTAQRGLIIGVNTADCVPVVLMDPVAAIYGVAHAGWRGAANGIVEATIRSMALIGSNPSDITAAMGPSICMDCFEVGPEVAQRFSDNCVSVLFGKKPHVSLQRHIHNTLLNCGLRQENIKPFNKNLCTRCHPDTYWSARKMGINSGRIYTFIVIR